MAFQYYSLDNILKHDCQYYVIFGERSNGKTYAILKYALEQYRKHGKQFAYLRRYQDDFKSNRAQSLFNAHAKNGEIDIATDGLWTDVYYRSGAFYFCKYDEDGKRTTALEPFGYSFSITAWEHDKGTSFPNITTIFFDEFLTRDYYLDDEFVKFMNIISTIVRHRTDVKVFMAGNTVNKYCPYFVDMGLKHAKTMAEGDIAVYNYGETNLRVAVERTASSAKKGGKGSDQYFAFDNPKLQMITGGDWEIDIYPHLPRKYRPIDVLYTFFIQFDDALLHCDIVNVGADLFIFMHEKTTPIKDPDDVLVYTTTYDPRPMWRRNILKPMLSVEKTIFNLLKSEKIFYSTNEVGEVFRNYLQWCK